VWMPTCNINHKGRLVRFFLGMILFFLGSIMFIAGVPDMSTGWRIFQLCIMFLGIFMIFEGVFGWCALRALMNRSRR